MILGDVIFHRAVFGSEATLPRAVSALSSLHLWKLNASDDSVGHQNAISIGTTRQLR
jgi:hypothetical protein